MSEGLSRHDAPHAIGSVLAGYLYESAKENVQVSACDAQARYDAALNDSMPKRGGRNMVIKVAANPSAPFVERLAPRSTSS